MGKGAGGCMREWGGSHPALGARRDSPPLRKKIAKSPAELRSSASA